MKLLLDTMTLLWLGQDDERMSPAAMAAIQAPDAELFVSVVSVWEMLIKVNLGKLHQNETAERFVDALLTDQQMTILTVTLPVVMRLPSLPSIHRDPFDRLLVCHALESGLTLVTSNPLVRQYPVTTLW